MFEVLLIEDDGFKADNIRHFLVEKITDVLFDQAVCLVDAVRYVNSKKYHLIIVDMAIPSHEGVQGGGSPMSLLNGGLEVILELDSLGRKDPCVVLTQFHEVEIAGVQYSVSEASDAIKNIINCDVAGCVQYADDSDVWKAQLLSIIGRI